MDQELIAKKELLELTGISYGQLYRWKRKNLIPEDWFIRKSTYTGQETFFPREKILERVDKIKEMKEDLSLDDLADMFSPNLGDIVLKKGELTNKNIVSKMSLDIYMERITDEESYGFDKILYIFVLDKMLQSGKISTDEGRNLLQTLYDNYKKIEGKNCEIIFIRKMGVSNFILTTTDNKMYFESGTKVVVKVNISDCIEELKIKLS